MVQLKTSPADQFPTPLTIDELAGKYNLKKSWFYGKTRLKGDERLPHIRMGKYIRIYENDFLDWLKSM